eukprot:gene17448-39835_t
MVATAVALMSLAIAGWGAWLYAIAGVLLFTSAVLLSLKAWYDFIFGDVAPLSPTACPHTTVCVGEWYVRQLHAPGAAALPSRLPGAEL